MTDKTPARPSKVVVVGAGIGGLAAAIALRQAGLAVEVYERSATIGEVGAGLSLWPNAVNALDRLGVGEHIRGASIPSIGGSIYRPDGQLLVDESQLAKRTGYDMPARMIHRADLHEILRRSLAEPIHTGHECLRVAQDHDAAVVHFANGATVGADLVIGADGLRSRVRAELFGDVEPRFSGYTAWRAVIPYSGDLDKPGETWGRGSRFGCAVLPSHGVYWFATLNSSGEDRALAGELEKLHDVFGEWHQPIPDLIALTREEAILRHHIYDRPPLKQWGHGRVLLIGDAAHPMTPNLGQGACQAIEDGVALANCLHNADGLASGLKAFHHDRVRSTARLVRKSRVIGRVGQMSLGPVVRIRDGMIARL